MSARPGNFPAPRQCYRGTDIYRRMAESPLWVCEPKLNGYRSRAGAEGVCQRNGGRLEAWGHPVICDGEWVRGQGFTAFDLLSWGVRDCRSLPYGRRRMLLEQAFADMGFAIVPLLEGTDPLPAALEAGYEGVVFKHLAKAYPDAHRPAPWWVKCKS